MELETNVANVDGMMAQFDALADFDKQLDIAQNTSKFFQSLACGKQTQHMVMVEDLRVMEGFNPRIQDASYHAHIRMLTDSIKAEGFYPDKPLAAVPSFEGRQAIALVTDGCCRLAAVKLAIKEGAEIIDLPVVFKDKATSQQDLIVALVKSNEGKRFTPIELSVVVKRLFKYGQRASLISERLGFTQEYVHQLLTLAGAPDQIRAMLEGGQVSAGMAVQAIRKHGTQAPEVLQNAVEQAKKSGRLNATSKDMPGHYERKILTKAAPAVMNAFRSIREDQDYDKVPCGIKKTIDDLFVEIDKLTAARNPSARPCGG